MSLTAAAQVDRSLALLAAARPRARREDHRVRTLHERGEVVLGLHVADDRLRAHPFEVGHVVGVPHDAARPVAPLGEKPQQPDSDLSVPSGDHDVHGVQVTTRS